MRPSRAEPPARGLRSSAIRIRGKLTLALIALALLPLAIISAGAYAYARRAVERSVMNHLESLATTQKRRIEGLVHAHERMLRVFASSDLLFRAAERVVEGTSPHARQEMQSLLEQWRIRYPAFRNLAVAGADGQILAATESSRLPAGTEPPLLTTERAAVDAALANPTEPTSARLDGEPDYSAVVSIPWSAVHTRFGHLLAELNFDDLRAITGDYTALGETGETVLATHDRQGNARYLTGVRWDPDAGLRRTVPHSDGRVAITRAMRGEEGVFADTFDYRGVAVLSATAYLPKEDWGIVVKIDRAEAFAPVRRLALGLIGVFGFACAGVIVVAYALADRIAAPVARLTRAAEAINRGELTRPVTVQSGDEIGVLADAFNRMTTDLLAANTRLEERVRERTAALEREMSERERAEHWFALAFEQGPEPMIMLDGAGRIVLTNGQVERVFAWDRGALAGEDLEVLFSDADRPTLAGLRTQLLDDRAGGGVKTALQLSGKTRDGVAFPADVGLSLVETGEGALLLAVIRDLRERQRAEADQALLAALVDSAHDAIHTIDTSLCIATWNAGAEKLYGYGAQEIVGQHAAVLWPPDRAEAEVRILRMLVRDGGSTYYETQRRHKDGTLLEVSLTRSAIRAANGEVLGISVIARNVAARKQAEAHMRASLHEKEVLLKEIHHRVKNNLQIVSSLLNLQASTAGDPRMTTLMRETQHRVKSMALMHETLYRSGDLAALDLRQYAAALVQYLHHSYGPTLRRVTVELDLQSLLLPTDSAIPCGLILTELVSNAFKYAFPDPATGTLRIEGRHEAGGAYRLRIVDDGRGMPPDVDPRQSRSLGLQLVTNLARQLHAELTHDATERGTSFTIRFHEPDVGHAQAAAATASA